MLLTGLLRAMPARCMETSVEQAGAPRWNLGLVIGKWLVTQSFQHHPKLGNAPQVA